MHYGSPWELNYGKTMRDATTVYRVYEMFLFVILEKCKYIT